MITLTYQSSLPKKEKEEEEKEEKEGRGWRGRGGGRGGKRGGGSRLGGEKQQQKQLNGHTNVNPVSILLFFPHL